MTISKETKALESDGTWARDRVNELAISIRETDAKIQSDFHWISPQREIPAEEERLALSH